MLGFNLQKQSHYIKATPYRQFPVTSKSTVETLPLLTVNDIIYLMASLNVIIKYQVLSLVNYLVRFYQLLILHKGKRNYTVTQRGKPAL